MSVEEAIRLLLSFLGGSLFITLIGWAKSAMTDRSARHIAYLNDQLKALYGPLYFLSSQNDGLMRLWESLNKAYESEYCKSWSEDADTKKAIDDETSRTIHLMNDYGALVRENNEKTVNVLQTNSTVQDSSRRWRWPGVFLT